MGCLLDLPLELLELIVGYLHDDNASLKSLSLVSRVLLPPSQVQLFRWIHIRRVLKHSDGNFGNVEGMQKSTSPDFVDPQVLSYTQTLSLSMARPVVSLQHLNDIFDRLIAFKKVRQLRISLFATQYVRRSSMSLARYFAHSSRRCVPSTSGLG